MDHTRAAATCLTLAVLFCLLGFVTVPGFVGSTAVSCTAYEDPHFVGIEWESFLILWNDGCNTVGISGFAAIGALYLAVAAGFAGVAAVQKTRARIVRSG